MAYSVADVEALFALPFNDLLFKAHGLHRQHFDPNAVQVSTLLSIKTGGCSEDCSYCSQSARYHTGIDNEGLMPLGDVLAVPLYDQEGILYADRDLGEITRSRFELIADLDNPAHAPNMYSTPYVVKAILMDGCRRSAARPPGRE